MIIILMLSDKFKMKLLQNRIELNLKRKVDKNGRKEGRKHELRIQKRKNQKKGRKEERERERRVSIIKVTTVK